MGVGVIVGEGVNVGADVGVGDGVAVVPHAARNRIITIMVDSNIFLVNIFLLILNIERRLTTGDIVPALACPAVFVGRFLRGSRARCVGQPVVKPINFVIVLIYSVHLLPIVIGCQSGETIG